ncbi:hypothetical protein ACFYXC_38085 [Streptomyces sp. NPDC002701]
MTFATLRDDHDNLQTVPPGPHQQPAPPAAQDAEEFDNGKS